MFEQLVEARKAKQEKKEAKEEATQEKRLIFLQNQLDHYQRELNCLKKKLDQIENSDIIDKLNQNVILDDLVRNCNEYRPETINLALQIKSISSKAYELLSNNLNFPTTSYIDKKFKESIADIPQKITNIYDIGDIINLWKDKFGISKSQEIKACLAVDALYFKADFKITIDDCVSGFLLKDEKDLLNTKYVKVI